MNNTIRQIIILKLAQFMSAFIVAHPLNNMQAMYLWYMMKRLMMYTKDFFWKCQKPFYSIFMCIYI